MSDYFLIGIIIVAFITFGLTYYFYLKRDEQKQKYCLATLFGLALLLGVEVVQRAIGG